MTTGTVPTTTDSPRSGPRTTTKRPRPDCRTMGPSVAMMRVRFRPDESSSPPTGVAPTGRLRVGMLIDARRIEYGEPTSLPSPQRLRRTNRPPEERPAAPQPRPAAGGGDGDPVERGEGTRGEPWARK